MAALGAQGLPRTNLLRAYPGRAGKGAAFPAEAGRAAAQRLLRRTRRDVPLVLLGTRVAASLGLRRADYDFLEWIEHRGRAMAVVPHPSGIVLWWNDPENRRAAREFFEELRSW